MRSSNKDAFCCSAYVGHRIGITECPLLTQCMVRPCVARRFDELVVSGLASMYQTSDWSLAPGHHGYQRAGVISGKASTDHLGHQCSHAPGRPNLHLISSSRRPRRVTRLFRMLTRSEACSLQRCGFRPKHPMRCAPVCWRARSQARCGAVAS